MIDYNSPLYRYTDEERRNMTLEEYGALLNEQNKYMEEKEKLINEEKLPKFNSLQEIMDYFHAIPFDEAVNKLNKLFE
jgi:hypothetical protein